ncbi:aldolase, partial [Bacillus anthracis]
YNDHLYNKNEKTIDFKSSKLYRDMKEIEDIPKLKLIVRDVGCGNRNEVVRDRFRLIYDLGGDIKFSNKEMENIFTRVNLTGPYYAVISHWDLDHYRAVLDLDDAQLALMKNIV